MALRFVVAIRALPGKREEMIKAYASLCSSVREEPGCQQFETYQNIEAPDRFVVLERWADQESLTTHVQRMQDRGLDLDSVRIRVGEPESYTT